jgi:hypothetical protein
MQPLPRPGVSPLPSYCTVPIQRSPSLAETVRAIWRWCRAGRLTARERQLAEALVERLAAEIEEEGEGEGGETAND